MYGTTVAQAVPTTGTFTTKIKPNKTSKPIQKLTLSGTWDAIPGPGIDGVYRSSPIPKLIQVTLPKAGIDRRALKGTDRLSKIENNGRCSSSRYKIGKIVVVAHAAPLVPTLNTRGDICIIKRKKGSALSIVLAIRYPPLGIILAIPVEVKQTRTNTNLVVDTGVLFGLVAGQSVSVESMTATINRNPHRKIGKKKNKKVYLLNTPKSCSKKRWIAFQTTTFQVDPNGKGVVDQLKANSPKIKWKRTKKKR